MADRSPTEEAIRKALEANTRYYEALGRVTTEYVQTLTEIFSGVKLNLPPIRLGVPATEAGARPATAQAAPQPTPSPQIVAEVAMPALVLEGAPGEEVRGVFAVSNELGHDVSAPVMSRSIETPVGVVELRAAPALVEVATGAQALVEVGATVPEGLPSGESFEGQLSVPGLSSAVVTVILRRADPARGSASPAKRRSNATKRRR